MCKHTTAYFCIKNYSVLPTYLQTARIHNEIPGGEVEGAILTQLSIPVLTPRPVGWVQI